MINKFNLENEFKYLNEFLSKKFKLTCTNIEPEVESKEYGALNFKLGEYKIKFRIGKITPTKIGFFVTLWQRNILGKIEPFSSKENIDYFMIVTRNEKSLGLFIFPKLILLEKGILSSKTQKGKLAFRVYPTWEKTINKQSIKTKEWQSKYFIDMSSEVKVDTTLFREYFF